MAREPRAPTRPFPPGPRSAWVERERVAPTFNAVERFWEFEYEVFESAAEAARPRGEPFFIVNHKAQIRADHQRVLRGPNDGLMHVDVGEVLIDDLETFLESDVRAYRWVTRTLTRWTDDRGRILAPFIFPASPWAGGQDEQLDPQWQRETFTVPIADQIVEIKQRRLDRVEQRQESGDRRGTTLNLQVGASADDADQTTADVVSITSTGPTIDATTEHVGLRFQGVTIANAATINSAFLTVFIQSGSLDEPQHQLRGQAADNAAVFTTAGNSIDSRARTTATVQWNSADLGSGAGSAFEWGSANGSPTVGADIKAIIQEIVNRPGWVSGNSLVLIFEQHTADGARDLSVNTFDGGFESLLDIDYTATKQTTRSMHQYRLRRV